MSYKPGDLFLGVIDFFGILVPGAVLLFLFFFQHPKVVASLDLYGLKTPPIPTSAWVAFFLASYVLGHFLTSGSVPLNRMLEWVRPGREDKFYNRVKASIALPPDVIVQDGTGLHNRFSKYRRTLLAQFNPEPRTPAFYWAYAFIRLQEKTSALAEIERQMAEYKLFRSLTAVFFLDIVLWCLGSDQLIPSRLILSIVLLVLASSRFVFLLGWTYRITFEYYALLRPEAVGNANAAGSGLGDTV